ncbi:DNA-binding MarR family transcriptional regulator [Chryseobacterium bernardetii]|jgi:DNA-binding MarR family transcriptional regulator|uniref:DNA-binding MarR family transcriptional regulator n=2 Tax=Chryseobacterium TaxID=59732 RepID=A0A543EG08_9FLAO|nr:MULTISPECIES: MarR family transcriptional regulator [Chryseobacterium]MDR6370559.1 DNA-binding MarR family transcriptional regulator [Chryseobacterium vietnamense]MDR6441565.1 DNA-binding MarR family transcriptional regulator [Chryseobacterium bernardetii]TQM20517.1 DNA-binding MarR family transcriptional regulator [Chryseobacterium aquifrigidense]
MEKLNSIIFYNIDKAIRAYRNYAQRQLKAHGYTITIDQWLIIKAILENPGITQNEIGDLVFKDNASVTRIIDLMVKCEYIIRKVHPEDRRKTNLEVTDSGVKVIKEVQNIVEKNRKTALKGIREEELEVMYSALLKISENCLNPKK